MLAWSRSLDAERRHALYLGVVRLTADGLKQDARSRRPPDTTRIPAADALLCVAWSTMESNATLGDRSKLDATPPEPLWQWMQLPTK
jgi:hypothetical protein